MSREETMVNLASWRKDAACATADNPDLWFAGADRQGIDRETARLQQEAARICGTCPVVGECLEYALEANERYGVWGGVTSADRRKLRRAARGVGGLAGMTHGKRHTYIHGGCRCDICTEANAAYLRERRAR